MIPGPRFYIEARDDAPEVLVCERSADSPERVWCAVGTGDESERMVTAAIIVAALNREFEQPKPGKFRR